MQLFSFFFAFFYHYLTTIKNNFLPLHIGITILRTKLHSYMKKKILILDDKETIAKVLSIYLMSDYDVQWLPDGLQGVKWLQAGNTPDLIISDIRMPGMRGDDFLEWIKQNELFRHIPVIMNGLNRTSYSAIFPLSCSPAKIPPASESAYWRLELLTTLSSPSTRWS